MGVIAEGRLTLNPSSSEDFARFVDEFITVEKPWLDRQGTVTCGGWRRWGEARWQLLNLYRFETFADMQRAAQAGREDAEAAANLYSWLNPAAFQYRRHFHIETALAPPGRMEDIARTNGTQPRQYVEIRRKILFRQLDKALEIIGQQISAQEAAGLFELAIAYDTLFGDFGDLTVIGLLPGGASSLRSLDDYGDAGLAAQLAEVTVDERVFLLDPLPYSPLR